MSRWSLRRFRFTSIQLTIAVSFTAMTVLVVTLVGVVLYTKFNETAEKNTSIGNEQVIDRVATSLEYYIRSITAAFSGVESQIQKSEDLAGPELLGQFDTIFHTREDLVTIALFTFEGQRITSYPQTDMRANTHLTTQSWFRSAVENPNHLSIAVPHVQNLFKGPYRWVVSMSKGIQVRMNGRTLNAVLLVDVNFKMIDDLIGGVRLGQKGYAYIIDDSAGNIIYHPQQQLIYAGLKYENVEQALKYTHWSYKDESNGASRLVSIQTVRNVGWKIVGVSYMDEIMTTRKEISAFVVYSLLGVAAIAVAITLFLSVQISRPIQRLEKSMQQVERGNFDIYIPVRRDDEAGRLSRRFNLMVTRIRELMNQIIREQESKRRTELEVLQSQIHPHFLYNTLNSVVRMVGAGRNDDAITMITSLSKFFRISLSKGKHFIPLEDELEHVRNYLIIQKIRYKNKFEFAFEVQEEALPLMTLKLILQPIVENAVYHGIEPSADAGSIVIRAALADGKLRLQVEDNGVGMPREQAARLLEGGPKPEVAVGIGLRNVHERIRLNFGEAYGLRIDSEREEGTTVTLWLPRLEKEGEE